jgi:hypothetical protein
MTLGGAACLTAALLLGACGDLTPTDPENQSPTPVVAFAKGGGGTTGGKDTRYPTTVTFSDSENGYPLLVQSDGNGAYVQTREITNYLVQSSTGESTWQLTLYSGPRFTPSNRTLFFSLTEPVSSSNPPPPFVQANATAHVIAKCWEINVNLLALPVAGVTECPGTMRFQAPNGKWYRLAFQPNNYPEVDQIKLQCLSFDSLGCKSWQATPGGTALTGSDPNYKGVQKLVEIDPSTTAAIADLGDYYVSFRFVISR